MEKTAQGFAQKIVSQLNDILSALKGLTTDRPSANSESTPAHANHIERKDDSAQKQTTPIPHVSRTPSAANESNKKWSLDWWKSRIEFVAFLFAIGYACVTYCQWRDANRNFTIEQRAFVYLKEILIVGDGSLPSTQVPDKPARVVIDVENSGATFARDVTAEAGMCAVGGKLPSDFSFPTPIRSDPLLIAPRGPGQISFDVNSNVLNKAELGNWVLYVWGTITYRDIFGAKHLTAFSQAYKGWVATKDGTAIEKHIFGSADYRHNCQDEDCPKEWGNNPSCAPTNN
jgi:hypothetical protein